MMGKVTCKLCEKQWDSLAAHLATPCGQTCKDEAELKRKQKQEQAPVAVKTTTATAPMRIRVRRREVQVDSDYNPVEEAVFVEVPSVVCIDIAVQGGKRRR